MKRKNLYSEITQRDGQVPNNAGGYSYEVDKWTQLSRFLILGSDTGTYYVTPQELTLKNAKNVIACLKEDPGKTLDMILEVSESGRSAKQSQVLFAYALVCSPKYNVNAKFALSVLEKICRTSTQLFEFLEYVQQFRGWGRSLREAVSDWYLTKPLDRLQYQLVKYRQRNGWTHRDILRLAHPTPTNQNYSEIFHWVTDRESPEVNVEDYELLFAFERAQGALQSEEIVDMIQNYRLPWEAIPTQWMSDKDVRMALLRGMPMTAMIRQLGIYSSLGLTEMRSEGEKLILDALGNQEALRKSRIHPMQILVALQTYQTGHGNRGGKTWNVNQRIAEALEGAYYHTFENIVPSNARMLLAIDISSSMRGNVISGLNNMSATYAAAATALATVNSEPYVDVVAYHTEASPRNINKTSSISQVQQEFYPNGNTDCGAPMLWAMKEKKEYDIFVIYTDGETWYGNSNPYQQLKEYRQRINPDAKAVMVAMTPTRYSVLPSQSDARVLDCIGFDSLVPQLISSFAANEF